MLQRALRATSLSTQSIRFTSTGVKKIKPTRFSVDRTQLDANLGLNVDETSNAASIPKEIMSPLGKDLKSYIKLKGAITLHDYMAQCLNHLMHGYYQSKGEVIGKEGDFITAPEVSQLFGEMIGIWCLSMWEQLGKPDKINLVELGPGKGTLMKDLLKVTSRFEPFKKATSVHMVELSIPLRRKQYELLGCTGVKDFSDARDAPIFDQNGKIRAASPTATGIQDSKAYKNIDGTFVHWHSFLYQVPSDAPVLIIGTSVNLVYISFLFFSHRSHCLICIGQEFLDAFPVHQFTYTNNGWRERLVDVNGPAAAPPVKPHVPVGNPRIEAAKQSVLSKTNLSTAGAPTDSVEETGFDQKKMDEEAAGYHFRLVLSNSETPAVKLLLTGSEAHLRRDALEQAVFGRGKPTSPADLKPLTAADVAPTAVSTADTSTANSTSNPTSTSASAGPKVGDGIEVCPLAIATCEDIAQRVVKAGGAALLFDYGEDFAQEDSLRAFKKHQQVSVLSQVRIPHSPQLHKFSIIFEFPEEDRFVFSDCFTNLLFTFYFFLISPGWWM